MRPAWTLVAFAVFSFTVSWLAGDPVTTAPAALPSTTTTAPPATTTTSAAPTTTTTLQRASRSLSRPRPSTGCVAGVRFCWTDDPFDAVSACEAGMNAQRVSANRRYYGAFQWDLSSWHGLGEVGFPTDFGYAYQKAVAQRMQAARGWSPWPTCARRLGLL